MNAAARLASAFAAVLLLLVSAGERGAAAVTSGTRITNQATATYQNVSGSSFVSLSNVVSTTVALVSSLAFGPQDSMCSLASDGIGLGKIFSKTFVATNTSNGPESFRIVSATVSSGALVEEKFIYADGTSSAAFVDGAPSNPVPPGASVSVVVFVNSASVPLATRILVSVRVRTAETAVNGSALGIAQQCAVTTTPPVLSGLGGPSAAITKIIDGVHSIESKRGATVVYDVTFKNFGGAPATNVVLDDPLPVGILPVMSTVSVNGIASGSSAHLVGTDLKVTVGTVAIGATVDVRFTATVGPDVLLGSTMVNIASVGSSEVAPLATLPASLLLGSGDLVYDGVVGASGPVAGAVVSLVDASGSRVALSGPPVTWNMTQADPMTTAADGRYGFGLLSPKGGTYFLTVSAPGYLSRRIQIVLVPDASGTLYSVTMTSLDGEPLAVAGGFDLVAGSSRIADVYGMFGNIPLFRPSALTVVKTVDRAIASAGDRLVYTITASNVASPLGYTTVVDDLPQFVGYAPGTGRVDGLPAEPVVSGSRLTWTFPVLERSHVIRFAAVVLPNVSESANLINHVVARAFLSGSGGYSSTARAEAQTVVVPGLFSNRIPITGRVYVDRLNLGRFVKGDSGISGVRVWLENGESVVTDAFGRYDFPAERPGMHVLHVDSLTLPSYVIPYDTRAYNDERSIVRLVHGIFDGALLQDVNFAIRLVALAKTSSVDPVAVGSVGTLR